MRAGAVSVLRGQLRSRPFLFRAVVGGNIQDLLAQLRPATRRMSLRAQQHNSLRLVPAGEVVELLILTERGNAGRHIRLAISEEHDHAVAARVANQARAPLVKYEEGFALPGAGRQRCPQDGHHSKHKNCQALKTSSHQNPFRK